jgi:hypothetical protein
MNRILFKIIIIILGIIILFLIGYKAYALDFNEAQNYVGKFCYVKYYKYERSNIEIYNRIIGKILDIIYDEDYKFIILDYKADLYWIKIEKVKTIKIIREN